MGGADHTSRSTGLRFVNPTMFGRRQTDVPLFYTIYTPILFSSSSLQPINQLRHVISGVQGTNLLYHGSVLYDGLAEAL